MNSSNDDAWIHVGNCPVCQCGLRRVRACTGAGLGLHGYILCDDCETLWPDPSPGAEQSFPDMEQPACPICRQPLFGPQARWATLSDLSALGWQDQCIIEPKDIPNLNDDLLDPEDLAADLDAPEHPTHERLGLVNNYPPTLLVDLQESSETNETADESAEPKPGC